MGPVRLNKLQHSRPLAAGLQRGGFPSACSRKQGGVSIRIPRGWGMQSAYKRDSEEWSGVGEARAVVKEKVEQGSGAREGEQTTQEEVEH